MELHDQAAPAVKIVAVIARGILRGDCIHADAIRFLAALALTAVSFVVIAQNATVARATEVDLLLALVADVSGSINDEKFALQREGYSAGSRARR